MKAGSDRTRDMALDWQRVDCEIVDAPSLEALKARLDGAVSNLV